MGLGFARILFHVEHMTPEAFQIAFNVPRGTMERLETYEKLLLDWQGRMNLVGPATLPDIWSRHFADSAQLARLAPNGKHWIDMGAGAGFPGMVLAAMDWGSVTLVESIAKKARFLEALRDALGLTNRVTILCARVESLPTLGADIATARAAAPLSALFDWAIRHVRPGGIHIYPKGRRWAEEVDDAEMRFSFDLETHPSMTDPEARILIARNLKRL
jgi:16S rRNA (guanine527-N7)-methyltransferase